MLRDCVGEKYLRCSLGWAVDEYYNPNVHTEAYDKEIHGKDKVIADHWDEADIVERRMAWAFKIVSCVPPDSPFGLPDHVSESSYPARYNEYPRRLSCMQSLRRRYIRTEFVQLGNDVCRSHSVERPPTQ